MSITLPAKVTSILSSIILQAKTFPLVSEQSFVTFTFGPQIENVQDEKPNLQDQQVEKVNLKSNLVIKLYKNYDTAKKISKWEFTSLDVENPKGIREFKLSFLLDHFWDQITRMTVISYTFRTDKRYLELYGEKSRASIVYGIYDSREEMMKIYNSRKEMMKKQSIFNLPKSKPELTN